MWSIVKYLGDAGSYTILSHCTRLILLSFLPVMLPRFTRCLCVSQHLSSLPRVTAAPGVTLVSFEDFRLVFAWKHHIRVSLGRYETLIRQMVTKAAAFGYKTDTSPVFFMLFSVVIKGICHVCWCHSDSFWQGRNDERMKARACLALF